MPSKRRRQPAAQNAGSSSITAILESRLFLGPRSAASTSIIATNSITHVLSIGTTPSPKLPGVNYHRLALTDSVTSSLANTIALSIPIIKDALASHNGRGAILVHCVAGVSRSPAVVVGYLMKEEQMRLKEALGLVIRSRPQVSPNPGFLKALKELEAELFEMESMSEVEDLPRRESDRLALFFE